MSAASSKRQHDNAYRYRGIAARVGAMSTEISAGLKQDAGDVERTMIDGLDRAQLGD